MRIRSARRVTTLAFGMAALLVAASAPAVLLTGHAQPLPGITPAQSIVGSAVALSSDGTVALVGAPFTDSGQGAAYVYTKTDGVWSAPLALTLPRFVSGSPNFGRSVALSQDGTLALVGAPFENSSAGAVYAYTLSGGSWSGPAALSTSGLSNLGEFGYAIAMSKTFGTWVAIVGAPHSGALKGAAFIYTFTSGSWSSPTALSLTGVAANSLLGYSVALYPEAALVGAPSSDPTSTGNAYGYTQTSGSWGAPEALPTTGISAGDRFGSAVAMQLDGGLVGAPGTAGGTGAAYSYAYDPTSGGWYGPDAMDMTGIPSGGNFGASLAIGGGRVIIVGAPSADGSRGAAYFYSYPLFLNPIALDSNGVESGAQMGYSVALSGDEQTVAASATGTAPGYVFGSPVDMAVSVTGPTSPVAAGQDATFAIQVGNPDQSETASHVILTDVLPAGTTYVSATSQQGNCSYSQSTSTVTCSFGTVKPNVTFATVIAGGSGGTGAGSGGTGSAGSVTLIAGVSMWVPAWQDEVTLVIKTPAAGGIVRNTATLSADQELTGVTSANAGVTVRASASQGSTGGSSAGGTGGSTVAAPAGQSGGGGTEGLLVSALLAWGWRRRVMAKKTVQVR